MQQPIKRIFAVVIALVITCALLFGGYGFYNNYMVKKPLLQALNDVDGVQDVKLEKLAGDYRIIVALDQVDNLQTSYLQLDGVMADYLDRQGYELQVDDCRDRQLEDLFSHLQPYIYEALAKDNYTWLQEEIGRQIKNDSPNTDYGFFVDGDRIYLQFSGAGKSLYAIIPRPTPGEEVRI